MICEFDGLNRLGELEKLYCGKSIFLVTGKHSYIQCGAKRIIDNLLKSETVTQFSDFSTNPKFSS